ncbi:MAG: leucine-rich repeat domain-containing protein [Flavobacteriales bacterium]|nr:leucine-rich repeat domain-containing protein [Flavobacteriales bacterium]MDW8410023.1 leucine-rich repeat domain-containing protein [Flavobacteriales bacterium]
MLSLLVPYVYAQDEGGYFQDVPVYTSLREALRSPLAVRRLSLTRQKLTRIPPEVFELENLEELDLSRNKIREIPPAIGQLKKLRILRLQKNQIETLPEEMGQLRKLEFLDISRNPLLRLPESLGQCAALRQIMAWDTNLSDLPLSLNQLEQLEEVDLRAILFSRQEMQRLTESFPRVRLHFSGECQCGPY